MTASASRAAADDVVASRASRSAPPRRSRRRRLAALGIVAAAAAGFGAWLARDPTPHFVERRSTLARVEAQPPIVDGEYRLQVVRLTAENGLSVELTVRHGPGDGERLPVVLILGGHRTGRDAVRLLGHTKGAVVAAMSYPFSGSHRPDPLTFAREIPKIRRAFLDTPPAVMLTLDYLLTLPEVDTTRIEAVGVSLGAPFVTIAGALDERIDRVWAIHGSGGSYAALEVNMRRSIPWAPVRWAAAGIANVIIAGPHLASDRWAGRISPRPFVMINASDDDRMPRELVLQLYDAAREPKELIWTTGGHVRSDSTVIAPLVKIVWDRVTADTERADSAGNFAPLPTIGPAIAPVAAGAGSGRRLDSARRAAARPSPVEGA
ncbi:MAG TPA: hypothetical protein VFZ11_06300 [Gemmatimonadaceae bacterium]